MSKHYLYNFKFLGKQEDGFWIIRAPVWNTAYRNSITALYFRNEVFAWLFSNTSKRFFMGGCNSSGFPKIPALANNNSLCVLFEAKSDLIKFNDEFPVRQLSDLVNF